MKNDFKTCAELNKWGQYSQRPCGSDYNRNVRLREEWTQNGRVFGIVSVAYNCM